MHCHITNSTPHNPKERTFGCRHHMPAIGGLDFQNCLCPKCSTTVVHSELARTKTVGEGRKFTWHAGGGGQEGRGGEGLMFQVSRMSQYEAAVAEIAACSKANKLAIDKMADDAIAHIRKLANDALTSFGKSR